MIVGENDGVLGLDFREGFEDGKLLLFGLWRIFFGEDEFRKFLGLFFFVIKD